jgi:hypothetical protein
MHTRYWVAAGAACLFVAADARAAEAPLADIMAAKPGDAGIDVTVPTGGCTKKADFEVAAQPAVKGAARIEIRRLKSDFCKGNFPDGLKLSFTWDDLRLPAGTKLKLANAVAGQAVEPQEVRKVSVAVPKKFKKRCKRSSRGKRWCKARHVKRYAHKAWRHGSAHSYKAGYTRVQKRHHHRRRAHCPLG